MSIIKVAPRGFDLTDTYAFTGTVSGVDAGGMVEISSQTASASSSISFTGIDSTYRTYYFKFINMHPSTDGVLFQMNGSTDGGSNYNTTKTTTCFQAFNNEANTQEGLQYATGGDLAQSTAYQLISTEIGNDNDQSTSGELWLFNPSSTTYVKHFMSRFQCYYFNDNSTDIYIAGYLNTTSSVNAIDFKFSGGNIDDGTITMYGIA